MKMSEASQVLSHRNATHTADLFHRLDKLRKDDLLCDLTILVQGQKFKAHKVVMAACSDYFFTAICSGKSNRSVSTSDADNNMTVELQYVTMRGFAPLLEYAYTSELNVKASDVIDVFAAASYMQMIDVANACSEFMRTNLVDASLQSRLVGLQLLASRGPHGHINEVAPTLNTSTTERSNEFPADVLNKYLQATSGLTRNRPVCSSAAPTRHPPMLIPIRPYDTYQQWAAGTQNFLSHLVNERANGVTSLSPAPLSSSPNHKNGVSFPHSNINSADPLSPNASRNENHSQHNSAESSAHSDEEKTEVQAGKISSNNNSNNNNNNNKDSLNDLCNGSSNSPGKSSLKQELSDEENQRNDRGTEEQQQDATQDDVKEQWQSVKRLYNYHRPDMTSNVSPENKEFPRNGLSPLNPTLVQKPMMDLPNNAIPHLGNRLSMMPGLGGLSFHRHLLQRHFLAQQQQQQQLLRQRENEKQNPDLPTMPSNGQYMSVRRRTLQSNVPKPHQCQICGSRFTRYHNLKQHIKLHSGVKPYECDVCGKRFTRNYTLRLHKMKHIGIRNFRCGTCEAAFTSLGEFRAHLRLTMHSHLQNHETPSSYGKNLPSKTEDLKSLLLPNNNENLDHFKNQLLKYSAESPGSSGSIGREEIVETLPSSGKETNSISGTESSKDLSRSSQDLTGKRKSPFSENDQKPDLDRDVSPPKVTSYLPERDQVIIVNEDDT